MTHTAIDMMFSTKRDALAFASKQTVKCYVSRTDNYGVVKYWVEDVDVWKSNKANGCTDTPFHTHEPK